MTQELKPRLTLYQPMTYNIQVPGHLDESWQEWDGRMTVTAELDKQGQPVSTLSGCLDQAALQGLLRRLYSLGLPLIAVNVEM